MAEQQQQQQQEQPQGGEGLLRTLMRYFSYWMMLQMILSVVFPKTSQKQHQPQDPSIDEQGQGREVQQSSISALLGIPSPSAAPAHNLPKNIHPHWRENQFGKLTYYLVENRSDHDALRDKRVRQGAMKLHSFDIKHSDQDPEQSKNVTISLASCAQRNCSLFLHVYLQPSATPPTGKTSQRQQQQRPDYAQWLGTEASTACIPFVRFQTVKRSKLVRLFGNGQEQKGGDDVEVGEVRNGKAGSEPEMTSEHEESSPSKAAFEKSFMTSQPLEVERTPSPTDNTVATAPASNLASTASSQSDYIVVATIPPSVTVNVVADWSKWETKNLPPNVVSYFHTVPTKKRDTNDANDVERGDRSEGVVLNSLSADQYLPVLYINEFWILREYRTVLNASASTHENVTLTLSTSPLSIMKFMLYTSVEFQAENQKQWGLQSDQGFDDIKRMLLETEPWLLGITIAVSLLHTFFEYLTFSSDVAFWRGRKNFRGMSLRTVALNCYFQTVIFLYLFDGNETSYTVLIPSGIGVLIEYWKLTRTFTIVKLGGDDDSNNNNNNIRNDEDDDDTTKQKEDPEGTTDESTRKEENRKEDKAGDVRVPSSNDAPKWQFWKHYGIRSHDSYDESTRSFDAQAMRWLFYILAPCLVGYSVYSAIYDEHKGWYSFLIRCQVRFIYWTGFIQMTPQIFINYKKKSVGQLPWRAFVYKALNTFIDDLFAFVIKMPTMHRIAVFRDDLVFMILLYQRWIYPVDATRTDDGEEIPQEVQQKQQEPKQIGVNEDEVVNDDSESKAEPLTEKERDIQNKSEVETTTKEVGEID